MNQQRSGQRKFFSAGLAIAASVLTVSTLTGQPAASAATPSTEAGNVQPTSVYTDFTGWQRETPQEGWAITDVPGKRRWGFFNTPLNAPPGSDGTFASIYGQGRGNQNYGIETSLVSPAVDLTGQDTPVVEVDNSYLSYRTDGSVEVSLDGGATWSTVWEPPTTNDMVRGRVTVPIPQAAGHSGVLVRFHYSGLANDWGSWSIDNVFIGTR